MLLSLEQSILDGATCAYNILPTGGSPAGVKRSDETRSKMSAAKRGKTPPNKGKTCSEETRAKISAAMKGKTPPNKGRPHSDEAKLKMSASRYNKGRPVHLIQVRASGLKHVLSFPNKTRCAEALEVMDLRPYRLEGKQVFHYKNTVSSIF